MVGAAYAALDEREEPLDRVRVDVALHVDAGRVPDAMVAAIVPVKFPVRGMLVGEDRRGG